jgi:uncharacterized protein YicC (UPF0701 family)
MSLYNDIKMIGLGSMGSEVATLVGRYQREGKVKVSLSKEEKNILQKAIRFVGNMKEGYMAVVEVRNFNINSEVPISYNYYLRVRQLLPELGQVKEDSEIEEEIKMFADILQKLNEGRTLAEIGEEKIDKVGKFFSRLSDYALQELYVINNEKKELESI